MNKQGKRKGVSYYFRLEFSTLQGKITTGFCALGILAVVLMGIATWILYPAVTSSQHIAHKVQPAKAQLSTIQLSLGLTGPADVANLQIQEALTAADSLSSLQVFEQDTQSDLNLQLLKRRIQALSQLDRSRKEDAELTTASDINLLQSSIRSLTTLLNNKLLEQEQKLSASIANRTEYIFWILLSSIIFSVALGATVGSFIIRSVLKVIKMLKLKILEISEGKLIGEIPPTRNELNSIVKALNVLSINLSSIQQFAQEVGQGNFDSDIRVFDGENDLGIALAEMRDSLKTVANEEQQRTWTASGLAKFNTLLRADTHDLQTYCQSLVNEVVRYLNANQGAIYLVDEELGEPRLLRKAAYAYDREKHGQKEIAPGQGMVGQVYLEKLPVKMQKVPDNFVEISSGLGEATPRYLIVYPLIFNDRVSGVLEIAAFKALEAYQLEFLEKLCENIASALHHVENTNATARLLNESQEMTEAMQMQEEMLRQNSEELMANQEQLSRDLEELKASSALYTTAFEQYPVPVLIVSDSGQVLLVNKQAAKLSLASGTTISALEITDDKGKDSGTLSLNQVVYNYQSEQLGQPDISGRLIILHPQSDAA